MDAQLFVQKQKPLVPSLLVVISNLDTFNVYDCTSSQSYSHSLGKLEMPFSYCKERSSPGHARSRCCWACDEFHQVWSMIAPVCVPSLLHGRDEAEQAQSSADLIQKQVLTFLQAEIEHWQFQQQKLQSSSKLDCTKHGYIIVNFSKIPCLSLTSLSYHLMFPVCEFTSNE